MSMRDLFPIRLFPAAPEGGGGSTGTKAKPVPQAPEASDPESGDPADIEADEFDDDDSADESDSDDESEEFEAPDTAAEKKARAEAARKKAAKSATVPVSRAELRKLREAAKTAETAEERRLQAAARLASEREDKIAAQDGAKALDLARKRLQRDLDARDETIRGLGERLQRTSGTLDRLVMAAAFAEAAEEVTAARKARLRKGSLKHIVSSLSNRFEVVEDEEQPGEFVVLDRRSGETVAEVLDAEFDKDEFALFLEATEAPSEPARPRGTNRSAGGPNGKREKPLDYVDLWKQREAKARETQGVEPAQGLRPRTSSAS